ncbi:hypothetical protein BD413DRAFT_492553 [Trametes elegans]|nr:hypothetical protein BD413DRAFT_492553 [Trametes elegans]
MQHVTVPAKARLLSAAETVGIDLRGIGTDEAQQLIAEEQSELGYRPPAGSLAAKAQSAASHGEPGVQHPDPITLIEVAREDAQRVAALLVLNVNRIPCRASTCILSRSRRRSCSSLWSISYSELAAFLYSDEHRTMGFEPFSDNIAIIAPNLADQNESYGGS